MRKYSTGMSYSVASPTSVNSVNPLSSVPTSPVQAGNTSGYLSEASSNTDKTGKCLYGLHAF